MQAGSREPGAGSGVVGEEKSVKHGVERVLSGQARVFEGLREACQEWFLKGWKPKREREPYRGGEKKQAKSGEQPRRAKCSQAAGEAEASRLAETRRELEEGLAGVGGRGRKRAKEEKRDAALSYCLNGDGSEARAEVALARPVSLATGATAEGTAQLVSGQGLWGSRKTSKAMPTSARDSLKSEERLPAMHSGM